MQEKVYLFSAGGWHTIGLLDLNTAISLTFLSMGIWPIIRSPSFLPAGISLVYWAYNNSMMKKE